MKVGRLEPGDLWGMQHMHHGAEAGFDIVTVEGCEVPSPVVESRKLRFRRLCRFLRARAENPPDPVQIPIDNHPAVVPGLSALFVLR